jgi:hypothetical protein
LKHFSSQGGFSPDFLAAQQAFYELLQPPADSPELLAQPLHENNKAAETQASVLVAPQNYVL